MAIDYVEKHLYEAIHLSEVAAVVGVSDSYLSTLFKKNMNENFVSYVNRKKMERAKEMLAEGKLVYEISECLGYENVSYFSKVFRKVYGISADGFKKQEKLKL